MDLAINGGAHIIVSGDDHLLMVKSIEKIPIITAVEALELLNTINKKTFVAVE